MHIAEAAHKRLVIDVSGWEADLLRGAHLSVISARIRTHAQEKLLGPTGESICELLQVHAPRQPNIRPFKSIWSLNSHFPGFTGARSCDGHSPPSSPICEGVLDARHNFLAQLGISETDLNALNAALAVIKWKKLFGFYRDLKSEHRSQFSIDTNLLLNEDRPE